MGKLHLQLKTFTYDNNNSVFAVQNRNNIVTGGESDRLAFYALNEYDNSRQFSILFLVYRCSLIQRHQHSNVVLQERSEFYILP